jgi:hypothetical protein
LRFRAGVGPGSYSRRRPHLMTRCQDRGRERLPAGDHRPAAVDSDPCANARGSSEPGSSAAACLDDLDRGGSCRPSRPARKSCGPVAVCRDSPVRKTSVCTCVRAGLIGRKTGLRRSLPLPEGPEFAAVFLPKGVSPTPGARQRMRCSTCRAVYGAERPANLLRVLSAAGRVSGRAARSTRRLPFPATRSATAPPRSAEYRRATLPAAAGRAASVSNHRRAALCASGTAPP